MLHTIRSRPWRATALAVAVLALVSIAAGIVRSTPPVPAAVPSPDPVAAPPGVRTVVEHAVGDASVVVTVLEVGEDAAATMRISFDGGDEVLVAEEVVVGTDHFVHLPAAEAVLGDDVWIRFDLTDARHRAHLADHPIGLIELAAGPPEGDRTVRRERIDAPPPIAPPRAEAVGFEDLHELPDLRLPVPG